MRNRREGELHEASRRGPRASARPASGAARRSTLRGLAVALVLIVIPPAAVGQEVTPLAERLGPSLQRALRQATPSQRLPVLIVYETPAPPPPGPPSRLVPLLQRQSSALLAPLDSLAEVEEGLEIRERFWVVPAALAEAEPAAVTRLAAAPSVRKVYLDTLVQVLLQPRPAGGAAPAFTSPAIQTIGADAVWDSGVTGEGVTVAFFDSGVDGDNPMVASRWRGKRTSIRASWFDPFRRASVPQDLIGHGTQVAVSAVGALPSGAAMEFPDGTRIIAASDIDVVTGPAPRAEWIAARIFDSFGGGTYTRRSVLLQAFQWAIDPDGSPATDDAPSVINNSWGIFPGTSEFDPCTDVLYEAVDAAEAAGIAVVFAAGNTGPAPGSVTAPAARDDAALRSFGVGATVGTAPDVSVWEFSARGPSPCGGGVKPELVAPATVPEVKGTGSDAELTGFTVRGTSFSTALASGALALVRQVRPGAGPQEAKRLLVETATDLPPSGPDNDTGFGLLDVPAAVQRANSSVVAAPLQLLPAGRSGDTVRLVLRNRGSGAWGGGQLLLRVGNGSPLAEAVGTLGAGEAIALRVRAPAERAEAVRVTVLDRSGGILLSRSVLASPPNTVGGFVLASGDLEAGGNDFGRFGRIAARSGFRWKDLELLPAAAWFVAGGDRISDGMYATVLGVPGLKTEPPAAETDWAPVRNRTEVSGERAEFRFDDFEALLPIGLEVTARAEASDQGGVAALTITGTIRNLSGVRIADVAPGMFADWDLPGGESAVWSPALEAMVSVPADSAAPVTVLAADGVALARTAVPLGTPDGTGFYESASGILSREFDEALKLDLARGAPAGGLPGAGVASDQAQLVSLGPLDLGAGETSTVRFWLLAADSEQAAAARLGELRSEPLEPPGAGEAFSVEPPFPNPLRVGEGTITFPYSVPASAAGQVLLFEIYDVAGRRLLRRRIDIAAAAPPTVTWDGFLSGGREAASGAYLYVFRFGDETRSGRILLIR